MRQQFGKVICDALARTRAYRGGSEEAAGNAATSADTVRGVEAHVAAAAAGDAQKRAARATDAAAGTQAAASAGSRAAGTQVADTCGTRAAADECDARSAHVAAAADARDARGARVAAAAGARVAAAVDGRDARDTRDAREAGGMPMGDAAAFAGAGAGVIAHTAPRQMPLPKRVLAVLLSVLLVSTMWTDASIAEARTRVLGDTPSATQADSNDGAADAAADDNDAKDAEDAAATDADDADADKADSDNADASGDSSEPDLDSFLPEGLVEADKVLPKVSDKLQQTKRDHLMTTASAKADDVKRALQERFAFSLTPTGALRASDDAYQLGGGATLNLAADLGNLDVLLDGGYLGAVEDTDVVALTFTAPYVYALNADGTPATAAQLAAAAGSAAPDAPAIKQTLSQEEWKAYGGEALGMRVMLAADELPVGWTVWTEHRGRYLKHTAADLKAGLSGTIVFRYEGVQDKNGITVPETRGQLAAGAAMPQLVARIAGDIPVDQRLDVTAGYAVSSFTAALEETADGKQEPKSDTVVMPLSEPSAAKLTLTSAAPKVGVAASIAPLSDPTMGEAEGWATFAVTVEAAAGDYALNGVTIDLADLPDADGKGVPNAQRTRAIDVTDLSDKQRAELAAIDPSDAEALAAALEELDVEAVSGTPAGEGAVSIALDLRPDAEGAAQPQDGPRQDAKTARTKKDTERVIYLAVAYDADALVPAEDGTTLEPTALAVSLTAAVKAKLVQEEKVTAQVKADSDAVLADEEAAQVLALGDQALTFPLPPAPEAPEPSEPADDPATDQPEPEAPADEPSDEPADQPATDEPAADEPAEPWTPDVPTRPNTLDALDSFCIEQSQLMLDNAGVTTLDEVANPMNTLNGQDPVAVSMAVMTLSAARAGVNASFLYPTSPIGGELDVNLFDPNLVPEGMSTSLGKGMYLVNDQDTPTLTLGIRFQNATAGYFGGYSMYADDFYGSVDLDTGEYTPGSDAKSTAYDTAQDAIDAAVADGLDLGWYTKELAGATTETEKQYWMLKDYNQEKVVRGFAELGTSLTLEVPYLYENENGGLSQCYDYPEWVSRGGGYAEDGSPANTGKAPLFAIDMSTNKGNILAYWSVYLVIPTGGGQQELFKLDDYINYGGAQAQEVLDKLVEKYPQMAGVNFNKGLTGTLKFVWHGEAVSYDSNPSGFTQKLEVKGHLTRSPVVTVRMLGDIPENAGGDINYGGDAHLFSTLVGPTEFRYYPNRKPGDNFHATMGVGTASSIRKVTLLKTNLTWKSTYEAISDNVLFDRYNYMVYKINTTNTSTGSAEIDGMEYFLRVMNTQMNNNQGITEVDLKQWFEYPVGSGKPYKNPTVGDNATTLPGDIDVGALDQANYMGVPNQGGVLLYDTTDWLKQDYEALDKRTFGNIDSIMARAHARPREYVEVKDKDGKVIGHELVYNDDNDDDYPITYAEKDSNGYYQITTPVIPYRTNNESGRVVFRTEMEKAGTNPTVNGHLYPNGDVPEGGRGHFTFIMAVPYTTNIQQSVGAEGLGYYVDLDPQTTIYFGKQESLDRDYSWTDNVRPFKSAFGIPEATMNATKSALEEYRTLSNGTVQAKDPEPVMTTTQSYVGYPASYLIGDFATKGNMPLYGADADSKTAGPEITDSLPNYFRLYNLEFEVTTDEPLGSNENAPLGRYFDLNTDDFVDSLEATNRHDSNVVQLQVSSPANDPDNPDAEDYDWVNVGMPEYVETRENTKDGKTTYTHIYRLGGTTRADSLAAKLEARGIAPLPGVAPAVDEGDPDADNYKFTGQMRMVFAHAHRE